MADAVSGEPQRATGGNDSVEPTSRPLAGQPSGRPSAPVPSGRPSTAASDRDSSAPRPHPAGGRWPLFLLVTAIVTVVAVATAIAVVLVGLSQLQRTSDALAADRARVLAAALAGRIRATAEEDRPNVLAHAARRSAAEILLVDQSGGIVVDQSLRPPDEDEVLRLLVASDGLTESRLGRVWFAAGPLSPPLEHLSILAFVRAPKPAEGSTSLERAVALLTALLLVVAISVATTFVRAAAADVSFVRRRIAQMAMPNGPPGLDDRSVARRADAPSDPGGRPPAGVEGTGTARALAMPGHRTALPIRSLDQVGVLTAALNVLVARFDAAERSYRADLVRAADLDAERTRFLAGLSHELRTPLNAILGFTHLLESEDDGPLSSAAKEALAQIRQSGEHLRTLIDDILDLSAMESGQLRLAPERFDLRELCEQVLREARATVKDRAIVLLVQGSSELFVEADPRRIRQVVTNLVSNAIKFTLKGEVCIDLEPFGDGARLTVSDTGRGIDPDHLDRIFQAYRQSGSAHDRAGGAGLGLAIARSLVLLHGGRIEVASELGRGSTFRVELPVRRDSDPLAEEQKP